MTDSILRSYYNVSSSTFVPFAVAGPAEGALALLSGETEGFSIDATTYTTAAALYTGGPTGGTVAVISTGDPTDNLSNVSLDTSNLVQSGTSPKMVHNASSPYVRWSAHNYHLRSQELDHAAWDTSTGGSISANATTAPDATSTAETRTEGSGSAELRTTAAFVLVQATIYTISIYAKAGTGTWLRLSIADQSTYGSTENAGSWFNTSTGATGATSVDAGTGAAIGVAAASAGSGWNRFSFTYRTGSQSNFALRISAVTANSGSTRDNGNTIHLWGAQVNRGYIATPYLATTSAARIGIPQSYDTAAAMYGILAEPAATNLVVQSEDFSGWSGGGPTVTTDNTAAPDANTTADRITEGSGSGIYAKYRSAAGGYVANDIDTWSCYLKAGTNSFIQLLLQGSSGNNYISAVFDLSAVTASETGVGGTSGTIVSTEINAIGNGWYRCAITGSINVSGAFYIIAAAGAATGNSYNSTGDITFVGTSRTFWVWGAQLEKTATATSYIPTLTDPVTRAADAGISALTSTYPHSATVGTIAVSLKKREANSATADRIVRLSDGTDNEVIQIYVNTGDTPDSFGLDVADGGSPQVVPTTTKTGTVVVATGNQIAWRWKANDFAILADGGAEVTDVSGTLPTVTSLRLGYSEVTAIRELNGFIYKMIYVPDDRTQAEMQTLMDRF